jgi:hypothetical protein
MKTKRIIAILLSLAMMFSLCACGETVTETYTVKGEIDDDISDILSAAETVETTEFSGGVAAFAALDYAEEDDGNLLLAIEITLIGSAFFPEDPDTSKLSFSGDFADAAGVLLKVDGEYSDEATLNIAIPVGDHDPENFALNGDITLGSGLLQAADGSPYEDDVPCFGYYAYLTSDRSDSALVGDFSYAVDTDHNNILYLLFDYRGFENGNLDSVFGSFKNRIWRALCPYDDYRPDLYPHTIFNLGSTSNYLAPMEYSICLPDDFTPEIFETWFDYTNLAGLIISTAITYSNASLYPDPTGSVIVVGANDSLKAFLAGELDRYKGAYNVDLSSVITYTDTLNWAQDGTGYIDLN